MIISSIECDSCGKVVKSESKEFFTFSGNAYIGLDGGIVGNSLDENLKVTRDLHYCKPCTLRIFFPDLEIPREIPRALRVILTRPAPPGNKFLRLHNNAL